MLANGFSSWITDIGGGIPWSHMTFMIEISVDDFVVVDIL